VARVDALRRTLRGLPTPMLVALCDGLATHGDELVSGRLYATAAGGGCATGVLLRALEPERYAGGRLGFALRHRWRRSSRSYRGLAERHPRLPHLELTFDAFARDLRNRASRPSRAEAAGVTGRLFAAEARAELRARGALRTP